MPRTVTRRFAMGVGLVVALALLAVIGPTSIAAATPFKKDVYFAGGYERQVDNRTCTAASAAMMLNFIARKDLRLNQMEILRYEQPRDALNDATQRGSDPLGWGRAMSHFAPRTGKPFTYSWEAYASENAALKRAARQITATGKPVGILTMNGRHAVVMTGFEATADPRKGDFALTHVWISDPLGASHTRYIASRSPLDKYLELDATPTFDRYWYGKYVIVVPSDPPPPATAPTPTPPPTPIPTGSVVVTR